MGFKPRGCNHSYFLKYYSKQSINQQVRVIHSGHSYYNQQLYVTDPNSKQHINK